MPALARSILGSAGSLPDLIARLRTLGSAHIRRLWFAGRPVLFLTLLCVLAGTALAPVSIVLGLVFFAAGATAVLSFTLLADALGGMV